MLDKKFQVRVIGETYRYGGIADLFKEQYVGDDELKIWRRILARHFYGWSESDSKETIIERLNKGNTGDGSSTIFEITHLVDGEFVPVPNFVGFNEIEEVTVIDVDDE